MHAGDVIDGRFVVERFVARGGMGEVYRAVDRVSDKPVAIKVMAIDDERLAERFELEARALCELDHPAIVRYVAHGEALDMGLYLAMEWLDGITLGGWLKQHSLSLDQTLRLALRVAEGLGAAHKHGMVHRDIKPGNLFLVGRRVEGAKVLDFGLVRNPWQQITATGAGMGTPEYMSPEQARCERNVGPPADVFALGAVLYRCLTGQRAFDGEHVKAMLAKIAMFDRPPHVREAKPDVPPIIDELIAKMMEQDPARRPQDGAEAAELIRAAREGLGAADRSITPDDSQSLTTSEQQPAAVLFVDLVRPPRRKKPPTPASSATSGTVYFAAEPSRRPEDEPDVVRIRETVAPLGGKIVPLANGSVVVTMSGGAAAPELAARAARCALAIRAAVPSSQISVATRQVVVDDRHGAAPLIDGAASMPRARGIRVDLRTRELLGDAFELVEEDGAWVLAGERAATEEGVPRRLLGRDMPCVGRASVLRQLGAVIDGVIEDRIARAVVVVGDAGVGKSRVRTELFTALRGRDLDVIRAQGDPIRAGVPGGVIARAVRAWLGGGDLRAKTSERVADFLGELIGSPPPGEPSAALRAARQDPRFMQDQQRRAVEDWIVAMCEARPVAIVIDDLQWSDALSVELIEAALRRARDLPLFVLAFARPEVQQRFPKLDVAWARDEIRLEPLRAAACEQLVREALGTDATPSLIARLVEHSGGNPFYLEELIRSSASAEPASLPGSVLASLQLRIGAKPARARLVLRAASVYGRVFWGGAVHALVSGEMDRAELDEWLGVLERDELLERRGGARAFAGEVEYAFRHDLLRDASYQMLTPEDRRAGHRLAGAWLVAHGEADAVVLAEHFAGGGATAQAVSWFERAAEAALSAGADDLAALRKAAAFYRRAGETCAAAYANESAIAHLERAAAIFGPIDPLEAARTRLALAKVREVSGEQDAALEDLRAAEDEAGDHAELKVEILIARSYVEGRSGRDGALEQGIETAEAALALAKKSGLRDLEILATTTLAGALVRSEEPHAVARAVELAQRAVATSEDRRRLAHALWRLGNVLLAGNQLDPSGRVYLDALALAESDRDEYLIAMCHANMAMLSFRRWQLDDAIDHAHQALERHERIGYQTRILETTLNLGMFLHLRGESDRGRELLGNVLAQSRGDWVLSTLAQETLGDIERLGGREARAQARFRS
ncbi:MAG TPA: protein kinase, partial [Kofleriaceae bacterium]|nr:protein kinase [Kofleriaceae bacterium]